MYNLLLEQRNHAKIWNCWPSQPHRSSQNSHWWPFSNNKYDHVVMMNRDERRWCMMRDDHPSRWYMRWWSWWRDAYILMITTRWSSSQHDDQHHLPHHESSSMTSLSCIVQASPQSSAGWWCMIHDEVMSLMIMCTLCGTCDGQKIGNRTHMFTSHCSIVSYRCTLPLEKTSKNISSSITSHTHRFDKVLGAAVLVRSFTKSTSSTTSPKWTNLQSSCATNNCLFFFF